MYILYFDWNHPGLWGWAVEASWLHWDFASQAAVYPSVVHNLNTTQTGVLTAATGKDGKWQESGKNIKHLLNWAASLVFPETRWLGLCKIQKR